MRTAQKGNRGAIAKGARVIIAGDMKAHNKVCNRSAARKRKAGFWEKLFEGEALLAWNSEEATRAGPGANNHSTIDLTLSSPNIELSWIIAVGETTGSDHQLIVWEVLGVKPVWKPARKRHDGICKGGTPLGRAKKRQWGRREPKLSSATRIRRTVVLSWTWRDRLLGAATGAILTVAGVWFILVTTPAASLVLSG